MTRKRHPTTELRYYELPEQEPALALQGQQWVRTYGDSEENLHFHNLMEIGLCRWGSGRLILDDRQVDYGPGMLTLIPENCQHTTLSGGDLNEWSYLFVAPKPVLQTAFPNSLPVLERVLQSLNSRPMCLSPEQSAPFIPLFEQILAEYRERGSYHWTLVNTLLSSLLIMAARTLESAAPPLRHSMVGMQQILPAVEYITRCYMNPISVRYLAKLCSMSEAHLRRKFQEYFHLSPVEMLTATRVRQGCYLLNSTTDSVPEIAAKVGYQSVSSFERNFMKLRGMTPYQYRKNSASLEGKVLKYNISAKHGWEDRDDT